MVMMLKLESKIFTQSWFHDAFGGVVNGRDDGDDRQQGRADGEKCPDPGRHPLRVGVVLHRVLGIVDDLVNDVGRNDEACREVEGRIVRRRLPLPVVRRVPRPGGDIPGDGDTGDPPRPAANASSSCPTRTC